MGNVSRRLERIERLIGDGTCVCSHHQQAVVVIEDDWSDELKSHAKSSASFTCPAHGIRFPQAFVRISQADANL